MLDSHKGQDSVFTRVGSAFVRYKDGDAAAMHELVQLVTPIVWNVVRAQGVDSATAEDVVQSTWLALMRNLDSIDQPQALVRWMTITAKRECWRLAKLSARHTPLDDVVYEPVADEADRPDRATIRATQHEVLWQHFEKLTPRCRELLRIHSAGDRPNYAQIAAAVDMKHGSIGPTIGRCLSKLRTSLSAAGWAAS